MSGRGRSPSDGRLREVAPLDAAIDRLVAQLPADVPPMPPLNLPRRAAPPAPGLSWLAGLGMLLAAVSAAVSPVWVAPVTALLLWSARPTTAAVAVGLLSVGLGVAGVWLGASLAPLAPRRQTAPGGAGEMPG